MGTIVYPSQYQHKPVFGSGYRWNPFCPNSQGLVGAWLCNEKGGFTLYDLLGLNNILIFRGLDRDHVWDGPLVYFNQNLSYSYSLAIPPSITLANPFTVIWKSKCDGTATLSCAVNIADVSGNQLLCAYYASGYNGMLCARNNTAGLAVKPSVAITQTDWNVFAVTCAGGAAAALTLYVNGVLNSTGGAATLSPFNTNSISIAQGFGSLSGYCLKGWVDYCFLYNRVLTEAEIAELYLHPYGTPENPLLVFDPGLAVGLPRTGPAAYSFNGIISSYPAISSPVTQSHHSRYSGSIPSYPAISSVTAQNVKHIFSGTISSYPALESPSSGKHSYPYVGAISSYPVLESTTYGYINIPPPPPIGSRVMDFVNPLDIVDKGLAPDHAGGMGATDFLRSLFILDTNDYDGTVTFVHEIVAVNLNASDQVVELKTYSGTVMSSLTIPAETTDPTMFSAAWTPNPGRELYYWYVPDTGAYLSDCRVYTGRIIVTQTSATKTMIWRPLATEQEGTVDGFNKSCLNSHSFDPVLVFAPCGTFRWDPTLYIADLVNIVFEVTAGSAYGDIAITHCLWDLTDDIEVPGTRFVVNTGGAFSFPSAMVGRKEFSSSLLQPGHIYTAKYMRSGSFGGLVTWWLSSANYYRASIYIKLANVTKAEVVWRVSKGWGGPTGQTRGTSRARIQIPGGNSQLLYAKNETDSQPDTLYNPSTNYKWWIADDGLLISGDGGGATEIAGSDATQLPDSTPYPLPLFSSDFKGSLVPGDIFTAKAGPVSAGSDANAAWTLVLLGLATVTPPTIPVPPGFPAPSVSTLPAHWHGGYFGIETPRQWKMWRYGRLVTDQAGFRVQLLLVDHVRSTFRHQEIVDFRNIDNSFIPVNHKSKLLQYFIKFPDEDTDANVLELSSSHIPLSER